MNRMNVFLHVNVLIVLHLCHIVFRTIRPCASWNLEFATEVGKLQIRSTKVWDYLFSRFQGLDGRCEQQKKFWRESKIGRILQDSSLLVKHWWGWWDAKRYKSSVRRNIKKQFGTCINVSSMYHECINRPTRCTSSYSSEAAGGMLSMEACLPSVFHTDTL